MSWLGRLFGRPAKTSTTLVMSYRNVTSGRQLLVLEPLGRRYALGPGQKVDIFDRPAPNDRFVQIDNRGDVVTISRRMTAEHSVRSDGAALDPLPPP